MTSTSTQEGKNQGHSGSNKRQRTSAILVRLTPAERLAVEDAANRAGLTLASFARGQMLDGPQPRAVRRIPVERQDLARILGQLGKIGSNLNQLAKSANMDEATAQERNQLEEELKGLRVMRDSIMQTLGRSS